MPAAFPVRWQFERRNDSANKRLALALAVSLVLHAIGGAAWWASPAIAAVVRDVARQVLPKTAAELQPKQRPAEPTLKREVPMVFVEVDPAQATPEPPKETKNYSTHNSIAANPEPKKADVPKIDGTQKHVMRTMDQAKPDPKPLQPAPLAPKPEESKPVEANPRPTPEIGDLAMAKVEAKPLQPSKGNGDKEPEKPRERPRRLEQVKSQNSPIAGQRMLQEGGVARPGRIALDAVGSVFGEYDANLVRAVQAVWWNSIDEAKYNRRGKVKVAFVLHADGHVSDLEILETTVDVFGASLCQVAIDKPKNYGEWPKAMLQQIGKLTREVTFTFYYE